jgi:hypothetical protein
MTDPLSPSAARADDLQQRARQFIAAQKALLGDLAPCVTSDLLAALVQAEQREVEAVDALESLAWPTDIPQVDGKPDFPAHYRSMAARIVQSRDELKHGNRKLLARAEAAEAKLVQAEQEKAAANHGRKAAEDNQVRWMRLHSEAESRLSALTATVRQVEQEMQPYTNASNIKRWADTLRDALKEQG